MVLTLALLGLVTVVNGLDYTSRVLTVAFVAFVFFGRFIILTGDDASHGDMSPFLSSTDLFCMVTWCDIAMAMFVAFHLGAMLRLPVIGPRISALSSDGQFVLETQPWMKRMALAGLMAFVAFPLAATGTIGGSVLGRMVGLSRTLTFAGSVVGSVVGNGVMLFGSDLLGRWLDKDDPVIRYGGIVLIAVLIIALERRYRTLKQRFESAST